MCIRDRVPTEKLDAAYKKYLNPVMEGNAPKVEPKKQPIVESKVTVTGDRATKSEPTESSNIIEMKRLAGLIKN